MSIRDEIRELCVAHDKQMAEDREWLARRQARASPYVQKSDDGLGLVHRTHENAPAQAPAADDSVQERDVLSEVDETDPNDPLGYAVNEFADAVDRRFQMRDRWFEDLKQKVEDLRSQVDELRAMMPKARKAVRKRKTRRNV